MRAICAGLHFVNKDVVALHFHSTSLLNPWVSTWGNLGVHFSKKHSGAFHGSVRQETISSWSATFLAQCLRTSGADLDVVLGFVANPEKMRSLRLRSVRSGPESVLYEPGAQGAESGIWSKAAVANFFEWLTQEGSGGEFQGGHFTQRTA